MEDYLRAPCHTKILTKLIKEKLEDLIDKEQADFHFSSDLHFIGKAFDSVNGKCIWRALRRESISEKPIVVRAIYDGAK